MKTIISALLWVVFVWPMQHASAQKKEIKSNKDLPVLGFSTETLQPDDAASVNDWMKKAAARELPHIDSIFSNYKISNDNLHLFLTLERQSCNFILGNWEDLKNPDTVSAFPASLPVYVCEGALLEFRSYAEVVSQGSPDFSKDYIPALKKSLASFDVKDKEKIVSFAMQVSTFFSRRYEGEIKKIKSQPVIGDTSVLEGIIYYAYRRLKKIPMVCWLNMQIN